MMSFVSKTGVHSGSYIGFPFSFLCFRDLLPKKFSKFYICFMSGSFYDKSSFYRHTYKGNITNEIKNLCLAGSF